MGREQDYGRLYAETLHIPSGSTASFTTVPNMYGFMVQRLAGGSLSVGGPSFYLGASYLSGSSFAANNLFTVTAPDGLKIDHFVGQFNIVATGATLEVGLIRTFTNANV